MNQVPNKIKRWVWFCSPDSIQNKQISIAACVEIIWSIFLYWGIWYVFDTHLHLLSSLFVVPLLLLRSPASIDISKKIFLSKEYSELKKETVLAVAISLVILFGLVYECSIRWLPGNDGFSFYWKSALIGAIGAATGAGVAGAVAAAGVARAAVAIATAAGAGAIAPGVARAGAVGAVIVGAVVVVVAGAVAAGAGVAGVAGAVVVGAAGAVVVGAVAAVAAVAVGGQVPGVVAGVVVGAVVVAGSAASVAAALAVVVGAAGAVVALAAGVAVAITVAAAVVVIQDVPLQIAVAVVVASFLSIPKVFGIWVFAVGVRITSTLRFLPKGWFHLVENWRENMFRIDPKHPPSLLPGVLRFSITNIKNSLVESEKLSDKTMWLILIALVYIPALLYRWSIKSTFWFYWPIIYVRSGRLLNEAEKHAFNAQIIKHPLEWVRVVLAFVTLVLLFCILISGKTFVDVSSTNPVMIFPYLLAIDISNIHPWQWCQLATAITTLVLWSMAWSVNISYKAHKEFAKTKMYNWEKVDQIRFLFKFRNLTTWVYLVIGVIFVALYFPETYDYLPSSLIEKLAAFFQTDLPIWLL